MTRLLWVVAIALLAVRMTDAHLHMCLDGQEPRSSWHVDDRGLHHEPSEGNTDHVDTDVSLGVLLLKAGKIDSDDLPLLLFAAVLLWAVLVPQRRGVLSFDTAAPANAPLFYLRPPLRGPPALNSL